MQTAALITSPAESYASGPRSDSHPDARSAPSVEPTRREALDEIDPLIGFIPVAGPPAVLLVAPLVLLALAVAGPFVLMLTLAALLSAAVGLVALTGWILASPYLLVRHVRARRAEAPTPVGRPAPLLVSAKSRGAAA